jgi:uncharacterized membrane protein
MRKQNSARALAGLLLGMGTLHFAVPGAFDRIVPRLLGPPRPWTLLSGAAELAAGALVAVPRTRRAGAWTAAAVFVAVFPANIQMALDGGVAGASWPANSALASWLRLPLQPVLVWWAWKVSKAGREPLLSSGSTFTRD